jgi:uncharacterized delta-60 repeat protein
MCPSAALNRSALAVSLRSSRLAKAAAAVIESLERRSLLSAGDVLSTAFTDVSGHSDTGGAVVRLSDQKLLQVGLSYDEDFKTVFSLARFNGNGSPDTTFGPNGSSVIIKHLPASAYTIGAVNAVTVDPISGRIIVVGRADTMPTPTSMTSDFLIAAFMADGSFDPDFGSAGVIISDFAPGKANEARAVAIDDDGRVVVAGSDTPTGPDVFAVARYDTSGHLDSTFGAGGVAETHFVFREGGIDSLDILHAMAIDKDGNIILAGSTLDFSNGDIAPDIALQRYTPDGVLDIDFGNNGLVQLQLHAPALTVLGDKAYSVAVDADGTILVGGSTDGISGVSDVDFLLVRFDADGKDLIPNFGSGGIVTTSFGSLTTGLITDLAIQSDGAILVVGGIITCFVADCGTSSSSFAVGRYSKSGTLDPTFGSGPVRGIAFNQIFDGRPEDHLATIAIQPDADGNPALAMGSWLAPDMPLDGSPPTRTSDDLVLVRVALSGAAVELNGPASGDEGDSLVFTANFTGGIATGINFFQEQHRAEGTAAPQPNTTVSYQWTITLDGQTAAAAQGSGTATNSLAIPFIPADNGTYHVFISINGGVDTDSIDISVKNVAPTATINGAPETSPEGTSISLGSTVSDAGRDDTFTYAWSVTKNGSALATGDASIFSFTPDDDGSYVVTLTVTDDDGGVGIDSKTIVVSNLNPTAAINGAPDSSPEGTAINLTSTVSDPGSADTFTYAWSVTKNGTAYASGSVASFSFTPDDDGTYLVTLTVTDDDGGVGSDSHSIGVTNVAPTAAINGAPGSSPEGTGISLTSTVSDPGSADTFTYAWSVTRNGNPFASGSAASFSFTPDDNGSYIVTLTVTDDDGGTGSDSRTIVVNNVDPTATINGAPVSTSEGSSISLGSSVSDPGSADTFTYAWAVTKNGSAYATGSGPNFSFTPNDNGSYVVTLTVTDDDGGVGTDLKTILVSNVTPVVDPISGPSTGEQGALQTFTSAFTDPGSADTWTITWNFGDGTSQTSSGSPGAISASHTYLASGTYTVSVAVTDDDGGSASHTSSITISSTSTTALQIHGTDGHDDISVKPGDGGTLIAIVNGVQTIHSGITQIIITAGAGDDKVKVNPEVTQNVVVFGGDGDDKIKTGAGDDIIIGGDGDDLLHGNDGRDLLIGGNGRDRIVGNADSDILVAGFSDHDSNLIALNAILSEWTSARSYGQRTANVVGRDVIIAGVPYFFGGPRNNGQYFLTPDGIDATVFDDGQVDLLSGSAGQDLFLFNGDTPICDILSGLNGDEFAADIDFLSEP